MEPTEIKREISSVCINLSIVCPSCNRLIAVNGILKKVYCNDCGKKVMLEGNDFHWKKLLNFGNPTLDVFLFGTKFKDKKSENGAYGSIKLKAIYSWPKCKKCNSTFPQKDGIEQCLEKKEINCPKCSEKKTIEPAPAILTKYYERALYIIDGFSESFIGKDKRQIKIDNENPSVFNCSACHAVLPVEKGKQSIQCEYCGSHNFLPGNIFYKLNATHSKNWFILFDSSVKVN